MDPGIYKIIHFVGLVVLFTGLGSLLALDPKKPAALRRPAMIHGIGLLLLLVSGFGMQAKLKIDFLSSWLIAKLAILIILGGMIVVIKRKLIPAPVIYLLVIVLGSVAAYLGFSNSMLLRP